MSPSKQTTEEFVQRKDFVSIEVKSCAVYDNVTLCFVYNRIEMKYKGSEFLKFKINPRITQAHYQDLRIFVYSRCSTAFRLTFALMIEYLLFCSTVVLFYD